eukprot:scaffold470_cov257-Pinguiococcus_pyrenoidosus.AAC.5
MAGNLNGRPNGTARHRFCATPKTSGSDPERHKALWWPQKASPRLAHGNFPASSMRSARRGEWRRSVALALVPVGILWLHGALCFRGFALRMAFAPRDDWLPLDGDRRRISSRVAYDGSVFRGFQFQNNARTVQGDLEDALRQTFGEAAEGKAQRHNTKEKGENGEGIAGVGEVDETLLLFVGLRITGSGRTDANVHARGQAIHFDVSSALLEGLAGMDDDFINHVDSAVICPGRPLPTLQARLNAHLPEAIRVWNVSVAPAPTNVSVSIAGGPGEWRIMVGCY